MKKIITLFIICFIAGLDSLMAQNLEDVVYLKNGSIIRGVILEQIPNESIKIETRDGNIFFYKFDELLKLTREEPKNRYGKNSGSNRQYGNGFNDPINKNYYGDVNFGYGFLINNTDFLDLQIISGYEFSEYFGLGLGTGVKFDGAGLAIPVFANFRSEFIDGAVVPFASLNVGYNICVTSYFSGFYLEPKVGVAFRVSPKTKLNLGLSYALNNAKYSYYSYSREYISELWGTFRLSFGVTF